MKAGAGAAAHRERGCRAHRALGLLCLLHFAFVCALKAERGINEEVFFVCHMTLGLAGAALLLHSTELISSCLTLMLVPSAVWLFDALCGTLFNAFPLGITDYLAHADALTLLGTAHHIYLAPLLFIALDNGRAYLARSTVPALALFAVLSIVSRLALPPASNVNSAFALLPRLDTPLVRWTDGLGGTSYLLLLNGIAMCGFILPGALALRGWSRRAMPAGVNAKGRGRIRTDE